MNYEDLRKYQRMERNSPNLVEIDNKFYSNLLSLIKEHKEKYDKTKSVEDLKTLENILKIARDIFERREQKILLKSLRCVRSKEIEENNVVELEKDFFERLKKILKENRAEFDKVLSAETVIVNKKNTEEMLEEKIEKIKDGVKSESEDLNTVLVRILKTIPKFVSSDLREYGPYEASEIKKLPKKEAELLLKKKFVELV